MAWYYRIAEQEWGPVGPTQLLELLRCGAIPPSALVREGSEGEWIVASRMQSLLLAPGSLVPWEEKQQVATVAPQREYRVRRRRSTSQRGHKRSRAHPLLVAIGTALLVLGGLLMVQQKSGEGTKPHETDSSQQATNNSAATDHPAAKSAANVAANESFVPSSSFQNTPWAREEAFQSDDIVKRIDRSVVAIQAADRNGSGFLIDHKGTVVTNLHVVQNTGAAQLKFVDGSIYDVAGFIAVSPEKDLVLLRISSTRSDFKPLPITDELPRKGETVYALGSPRGYFGSITDGIVSAIRTGSEIRKIAMGQPDGAERLERALDFSNDITWIQTSSPISPGNSGGPLVNSRGEVIGVNTWMQTDAQNLNFAVSASSILELLADAKEEVEPLAHLPGSDDDPLFVAYEKKQAEEYRKQREEREVAQARQRRVAVGARGRRTARIAQEIVHLEETSQTCRQEIRKLASEMGQLMAQRERIRMSAKAIYLESQNSLDLMRRNQVQLNNLNKKLNGRQAKANYSDQQWAEMLKQREVAKSNLVHIREHGKILDTRYKKLNAEDKKLEGDLKMKLVDWQSRKKELSIYEIRFGELQVQFPK